MMKVHAGSTIEFEAFLGGQLLTRSRDSLRNPERRLLRFGCVGSLKVEQMTLGQVSRSQQLNEFSGWI